jgi:xylulokinase
VYKWFREEFCADIFGPNKFSKMDDLAAREPPGSKRLLVYPHFTGIQFPVTDDNARGVFLGAGLDTSRGCFIRAIMESIGYTMLDCIELLELKPARILSLGGGSKSAVWNQIKADISRTEVVTLDIEEASLFGAAILGGVASGIFSDIESACEAVGAKAVYRPNPENDAVYREAYDRYKQMYGQLAPLF